MRSPSRELDGKRVLSLGAVLACAVLGFAGHVYAQRPGATIAMRVSAEEVKVGQEFVLEIEVESLGDNITQVTLPNLDAFEIVARQVSQPTQVTWSSTGRPISSQVHKTLRTLIEGGFPSTFSIGSPDIVRIVPGRAHRAKVQPRRN